MAPIIGEPDVKYTTKDFESVRPEIIQLIKNRFPGIITDFSSQNVVTVIVELLSYLTDKLGFSQDAQAREAFFPTAKLRASVFKHTNLIGFNPEGRVAATALLRITLLEDSAFDTLIPAGAIFFTADENALEFQTLEDATLPTGVAGTFIEIYIENSKPFQEIFEANGDAFETFTTSSSPVLLSGIDSAGDLADNVLEIFVDGAPFTIVNSFVDSTPTSAHVTIKLDNLNRLVAQFGDGINGIAAEGEVRIIGRKGGGSDGNNAFITQGPSFLNLNNDPVALSFSNLVLSSGGANEQSIESIRVQAPLSLQAANRTVSRQDFITNAEGVSGIDRALPFTSNEDPSVEENKTELVIITDSPTNAQLIGFGGGATTTTAGVDDDVGISINGETTQFFSLGNQSSGPEVAAALQTAIRAAVPEFPLDNAQAYTNFSVVYDDVVNFNYILTSGQAGLDARIEIFPGVNDATVPMKLDVGSGAVSRDGAEPSAASQAAVFNELTVEKPVCVTHVIEIFGPGVTIINIDMRVRFETNIITAAARAQIRDEIRANMDEFFVPRLPSGVSNPEIDFGRTIRFSDLMCVPNDTLGVESVDETFFLINGVVGDVAIGGRSFPVLGGMTIRDESGTIV
jgi:hypothetical protein